MYHLTCEGEFNACVAIGFQATINPSTAASELVPVRVDQDYARACFKESQWFHPDHAGTIAYYGTATLVFFKEQHVARMKLLAESIPEEIPTTHLRLFPSTMKLWTPDGSGEWMNVNLSRARRGSNGNDSMRLAAAAHQHRL